jgi:hypothetical protein
MEPPDVCEVVEFLVWFLVCQARKFSVISPGLGFRVLVHLLSLYRRITALRVFAPSGFSK